MKKKTKIISSIVMLFTLLFVNMTISVNATENEAIAFSTAMPRSSGGSSNATLILGFEEPTELTIDDGNDTLTFNGAANDMYRYQYTVGGRTVENYAYTNDQGIGTINVGNVQTESVTIGYEYGSVNSGQGFTFDFSKFDVNGQVNVQVERNNRGELTEYTCSFDSFDSVGVNLSLNWYVDGEIICTGGSLLYTDITNNTDYDLVREIQLGISDGNTSKRIEVTKEDYVRPVVSPVVDPSEDPTHSPSVDPSEDPSTSPTATPVVVTSSAPAPAASTESTPTPTPTPVPTPTPAPTAAADTPFIAGGNGQNGWNAIQNDVTNAGNGETVVIDMNGASTVPGDVFESIKGKDVTIVLEMDNGISWSINGLAVTGDEISDINFNVTVGTEENPLNTIPVEVINNVTRERSYVNISLDYEGEFGMAAVLNVDFAPETAGLVANLFYYNPAYNALQFICADVIDENGTANLTFTHASDYTIVIDEDVMSAGETAPKTGDVGGMLPMLCIVTVAMTVATGVCVVMMRRKEEM